MLVLVYTALMLSLTGLFYNCYKIIFRQHLATKQRLAELSEYTKDTNSGEQNSPETPLQKALNLPIHRRLIFPIVHRLTGSVEQLLPKRIMDRLKKDLLTAGLVKSLSFNEFMVIYFLIVVVCALLSGVFVLSGQILLPLLLLLLGLFGPRLWLMSKVSKRKDAIEKDLPEFLDLLTVSVEAGLGFESSLKKVADEGEGPFCEEIKQVVAEISMGKSRKDAMIDLRDRVDSSDLTSFINSIVQAEQLGTGVSRVLKIESKDFRRKRRQRAEEQAMKAPVKLLIPLVVFIFPTIFIILLGPAALSIRDVLFNMF